MASSTPRPLEGRTAIITGASRGIGAAIAANLASKGCSLVLNHTSPSSSARTASLAESLSATHRVTALPVQADVASPTAPAAILAAAARLHPSGDSATTSATTTPTIDIIINNAGVSGNAPLGAVSPADFHRQYGVNVLGPLLLVQACSEHLPRDRSGRIVNVSSVSSSLGYAGQSVYGGTKAALEAMTRTWSRELAERATVNAVNPGPVATDMYTSNDAAFLSANASFIRNTPLAQVTPEKDGREVFERENPRGGRAATPEEVAGIVGMLCSAEAAWCTGSVVCANGGMRFTV